MDNYILIDKIPTKEPDLIKWATWFENAERHVAQTKLPSGVQVSTVFLGLDYSFSGFDLKRKESRPILFETMIFGGEHDQYQERYATWDEAEAGHKKAVKMLEE